MSMSSDDDSDSEEQKAALADALQCDFVQQAFDGKFTGEATRANLPATQDEVKTKSNFEGIIAKILAERLDEKIKESKKGKRCKGKGRKQCGDKKLGIQMISNGRTVTGDDLLAAKHKKKNGDLSNDRVQKSNKKTLVVDSEKQYVQRAIESAVTAEWVCSDVNTRFWARQYQWRLIKMKKLKSVNDNGAILCEVVEEDS